MFYLSVGSAPISCFIPWIRHWFVCVFVCLLSLCVCVSLCMLACTCLLHVSVCAHAVTCVEIDGQMRLCRLSPCTNSLLKTLPYQTYRFICHHHPLRATHTCLCLVHLSVFHSSLFFWQLCRIPLFLSRCNPLFKRRAWLSKQAGQVAVASAVSYKQTLLCMPYSTFHFLFNMVAEEMGGGR